MSGTIFCIVGLSELLGGNIFWGTHDAATGWLSTAINGHQGARSAHYLRNMAIIWPLRAQTKKTRSPSNYLVLPSNYLVLCCCDIGSRGA